MKKYDLTTPQKNIWNLQKFYENTSISNLCGAVFYDEKCDIDNLKKALNKEIEVQEGLRLRFCYEGDMVKQYVCDYQPEDFNVLKFDSMAELDEYAHKRATTPINMVDSTMYSFEIFDLNGTIGVLLCANHIISDAWSFSLLAKEVYEFCIAYSEGTVGEVPTYSYVDFINSERDYFASKRFNLDEEYWNRVYLSKPQASYMKTEVKPAVLPTTKRITKAFGEDLTCETNVFCKNRQISQAVIFEAAVYIYLKKINLESSDINIGMLVLNRRNSKEKSTVGMFVSTTLLKVSVPDNISTIDLCDEITSAHMQIFRHQRYPYSKIADIIRKKFDCSDSLYSAMVSFQNAKTDTAAYTKWYSNGYGEVPFSLHIDNRDGADSYTINIDYQTEIFKSDEEISLLYERLIYIIRQIISNPKILVSEINILPSNERQKLMYDFNYNAVDYPRDKCVHQLFEDQVQKIPNQTAVIACDKTLTYAELNEESNRIAHALIEKGISVGDIVAFMLPRKSYLISAMFGILKSGAAYLPLDSDYPQERIDYILNDSQAKFLITDDNITRLINNEKGENPLILISSEELCYCIFTSGSTGNPKGALLKHKGIVNLVTNLRMYNDLSNCNRFGFMTTITFDVATQEILTALLNGFTGVLMPERRETRPDLIVKSIIENQIDVMYATPTYFDSLTETEENTERLFKSIKVVCLAGEKFYLNNNALKYKNKTGVIFENQYGPVELHVIATTATVQNSDFESIGRPIGNNQAYIVNQRMQITPIGVTGELCIAGDGVGAGYLNRPELTDEKFVDNPFGNGKLYKTGDLAYWRDDGNIVYVGRNDFQVKIRGLRIELGEIENALCEVEGVSQATVVVRKNTEGRQLICAFYTGAEIAVKEIRAQIGIKLPKYMLPHILTHLNEMPLTSSGKINRKALPEVDLYNIDTTAEFAEPKTDQQKALCSVMEKVLNIDKIGIDDNFFELGCDSLKAIEFVSKAHYENIIFSLQNVFDYPTVRTLDEYIISENKMTFVYNPEDFAEIHRLIENTPPSDFIPQQVSVGDILLTGSTGFLGIHVLANYLENDNGTAYCIIRGNDEQQAGNRLEELLRYYFDGKFLEFLGNRIVVLCGDITKEDFGIVDLPHIDTIIHTAASVKHFGSYKYFKEANVTGTVNAIEIAKKQNAKLIHISTLSVSGNSMVDVFDKYHSKEEKFFSEKDLYIGQPLDNVYIRSKFEAECEVYNAILCGLKANVVRVGNLTNRASDQRFQPNYQSNAFLKRVKAVFDFGYLPEYIKDLYCEFSPVDETADAIMRIARNFNLEQIVFMASNHKEIQFSLIPKIVKEMGINLQFLDEEQFANELRSIQLTDRGYIYEALINDMDENGKLVYDTNIRIIRDNTIAYLRKIGFEWTNIDAEYLKAYIEYFRQLGFLNS